VRVNSAELFNSATPKSFLVPFSLLGILLTIYMRKNLEGSHPDPKLVRHDLPSGTGMSQASGRR
jgi:hypothetical protein